MILAIICNFQWLKEGKKDLVSSVWSKMSTAVAESFPVSMDFFKKPDLLIHTFWIMLCRALDPSPGQGDLPSPETKVTTVLHLAASVPPGKRCYIVQKNHFRGNARGNLHQGMDVEAGSADLPIVFPLNLLPHEVFTSDSSAPCL